MNKQRNNINTAGSVCAGGPNSRTKKSLLSLLGLCEIIFLLCGMLCVSCSGDDGEKAAAVDEQMPLAFGAGIVSDDASSGTRADLTAALIDKGYSQIGVCGFKYVGESDVQTVLPNYNVIYDEQLFNYYNTAEHWGYDGLTNITGNPQYLKYWDDENPHYQFVGYAPYATAATAVAGKKYVEVTGKDAGQYVQFNNFLQGNVAYSIANDFILAHYERNTTDANDENWYNKDVISGTTNTGSSSVVLHDHVPLSFHRLTSVVEFRIFQQVSDGNNDWETSKDPGLAVSNFTYNSLSITMDNAYTKGTVYESYARSVNNEKIAWQTSRSNPVTTNRTEVVWSGAKTQCSFGENLIGTTTAAVDIPIGLRYASSITPDGGIIQLPQSGVDMRVEMTIPTASDPNEKKTVKITNQTWVVNKRYIYYIIIPYKAAEDIKVVLKEMAWSDGGTQSFEVTDW